MSPSAALRSPVFLTYLAMSAILLLTAGIVLDVLRRGFGKDVDHARRAYLGWLAMIPILLLTVFLGRVATIVFFTTVAVFAFKEFARATGLYGDWWMTGAVYLALIAGGVTALLPDSAGGRPGRHDLFMSLPVFAIAVIMVIPVVRNRAQGQLQTLALAIVGFLYFGWMFEHVTFLANTRHAYGNLLFVLLAVGVGDVAAYTFGEALGRHPLRSNIHPRKTWEGAIAALAVSMALPWALRGTLPHLDALHLVLIGAVVGIGGQLGDLAIGVIKRDLGIKGMGAAIPGHGGIVDRIDSLIYVAPLFFHIVRQSQDLS